jgi:uncharacterized protein YqjF (DUF2071 family)
VLRARIDALALLHWPCEPADLQSLVPDALRVEAHDGAAWVGLSPMDIVGVGLSPRRGLVGRGAFRATSVHTYVIGPDGRRGIHVLSADTSRLGATTLGRTVLDVTAHWSTMHIEQVGPTVTYASRRRWPGPRGATTKLSIRVGGAVDPTALDHFLGARQVLWTTSRGGAAAATFAHEGTELHTAAIVGLEDDLLSAAGVPVLSGGPHVRFSPGATIVVGRRLPVGA